MKLNPVGWGMLATAGAEEVGCEFSLVAAAVVALTGTPLPFVQIILSDEILLGVASDLRRCPALDEVSRNAPPVPLQVSRVPGAQQVVNTLAYGGQVTLHCTLKTGRGTASPRALLPRGRQ
eukprot:1181550-Prorocentrum_minimum.AAC.2